jgi:cell division transport system permease protein
MFVFLYRAIKFALQGFFRNIWLSVVTIIILVLTLFSITMVAGINMIAKQAITSVQSKVDVSVYFKSTIGEKDILNVQYRLEGMTEVKSVNYVSKDEALSQFKLEHVNDPVILESLNQLGDNPLGATLIVQAKTMDDYPRIMSVLDNDEYKDLIQDKSFDNNQKVISRLSDLSSKIQRVGIIVSIIFIIIAILIVFNTIRINIYTHREEIGIMKLVGASNGFVRAPFLVESLLYAVLSVAICLAIMYPLLGVVAPQVNSFFAGYDMNLVDYFGSHFWNILGLQFLFAIILSMFSSGIAIGRYMKV